MFLRKRLFHGLLPRNLSISTSLIITLFLWAIYRVECLLLVIILASVIQKPSAVRKRFSSFGTIKSIRFRSVGVESTPISYFDKKLLKKVAVIKNNLSKDKKSVNAYIVYDSTDAVDAALSLNNTVLSVCSSD